MVQPGLSSSTEMPATVQRRNNAEAEGFEPPRDFSRYLSKVVRLPFRHASKRQCVEASLPTPAESSGVEPLQAFAPSTFEVAPVAVYRVGSPVASYAIHFGGAKW